MFVCACSVNCLCLNERYCQNCGSFAHAFHVVVAEMLTAKEYVLLLLAVLARVTLTNYGHKQLGRKVEVSTPLTSWSNGAY